MVRSAVFAAACLAAAPAPSPPAVLELHTGGRWQEWWRADSAPARWAAPHPLVARELRWSEGAPGVERAELLVSGRGEAWRIRIVLVRLDTARVRLRTQTGRGAGGAPGPWTIDSAPAEALVAVNAGQFDHAGPWGWVAENGVEHRPPGRGPLAPALAVDGGGTLRWLAADSVGPAHAAIGGAIRDAFQSYPTLLDTDGTVPRALLAPGLGVDHDHRDARVAIGLDREGRVVIALTRFAALGEALSRLPFGLTTPEMAAVMGAVGCDRAMLLDGGASSQLLVRDRNGRARTWPGIRRVPLGLVAVAAPR